MKEGVLKNLLSQAGMNTDDEEAVRRFFNDKHVRLVTYISNIGVEYLMMGNTILGTFSWNLLDGRMIYAFEPNTSEEVTETDGDGSADSSEGTDVRCEESGLSGAGEAGPDERISGQSSGRDATDGRWIE